MPQISRERESALFCAVVFVLVLHVSLVSFVHSFLSLSRRNENNFVSLSLSLSSVFCQTLRENTRERERGDCDGIPWCWKSGLDDDEDEDCKGDETKERRGDVDRDDVRDAPSFLVFALVFVRSCDSTDG